MADLGLKKCNCPKCGKELIRLEPSEEGMYEFWCDSCSIDICIEECSMEDK